MRYSLVPALACVEGGWSVSFGKEIQPQRVAPFPPPSPKFTGVLALNPIFGDVRQNEAPGTGSGHAGILSPYKQGEEIKKEPNEVESPVLDNIGVDASTKEHPNYLTNISV